MSLTDLPSLRWSLCVDTVVGQACQRVGCAVTVCGSHVKRVVKLVVESPALLRQVGLVSLIDPSTLFSDSGVGSLLSVIHHVAHDSPFTAMEFGR